MKMNKQKSTGELIDNIATCQEIAVHMKYYFEASDKVTNCKRLRRKLFSDLKVDTEEATCDCLADGSVMNEIGEFYEMLTEDFYLLKYNRDWCCYHRAIHKASRFIARHSQEKRRRKLLVRGLLNAVNR